MQGQGFFSLLLLPPDKLLFPQSPEMRTVDSSRG